MKFSADPPMAGTAEDVMPVSAACQRDPAASLSVMRIFQDEVYQKGAKFIRIVKLDRYEVEYKSMDGGPKGEGVVAVASKKEFCRLLKGMALVPPVKKDVPAE